MPKKWGWILSVLLALAVPGLADTIGPDCGGGNCFGSTYTLTYAATNNPNVFDIFLKVDATGYSNGGSDLLNAVAAKIVPNSSDLLNVILLSAPGPFSTSISILNANGCGGASTNGFFCSEWAGSGFGLQVAHPGDIYNWEWAVTLASPGDLLTALNAASIKTLYLNSDGQQNGLTSTPITLQPPNQVPEPASIAMLAGGLLLAAAYARRRMT